ncbi:uncharacterized protein LOC143276865 [Babylonia areolata]|uniref:uncharacterized protein LOC143276865 n=1 Tax=Babylonia areolata TaxID=304850 RepID=UPI003FD0B0E8
MEELCPQHGEIYFTTPAVFLTVHSRVVLSRDGSDRFHRTEDPAVRLFYYIGGRCTPGAISEQRALSSRPFEKPPSREDSAVRRLLCYIRRRYKEIDPSRKKSPPRQIDFLEPSKKYQVSGKYRTIETQATIIKCWVNGKGNQGPRIVVLPAHRNRPEDLKSVINCVSRVMCEACVGPVEKLYLPTGAKVMAMDQITHNGCYVALRKQDYFKRDKYEKPLPDFSFSPRLEKRRLPPLHSNKTSSHSSPEHSTASRNGYRRDRERARRDEDQVIMGRPVKYKRSSEKRQQVDYDEDNGGVFKARSQNRATRGAREVDDSRHTRTELPVDQRPAETVEDEEVNHDHQHRDRKDSADRRREREEKDRTYRTNARRATSPSNEQARREKEREAQARRRAEDEARAQKQQQQQEAMRRKKKERRRRRGRDRRRRERGRRRRSVEGERRRERGDMKEDDRPATRQQDETQSGAQQEEWAATKIQAGFRGYRDRRDMKQKMEEREKGGRDDDQAPTASNNDDDNRDEQERAATKIQAGFRGAKARQEVKAMRAEQEASKPPQDDQDEQERAATKIQAGFRGAKARREVKAMRDEQGARDTTAATPSPRPPSNDPSQTRTVSPNLDPNGEDKAISQQEAEHAAATKIQAAFRGQQTRKELAEARGQSPSH